MFENAKIKKILKPRKEFEERSKAAFLAVYDTAHPAGQQALQPRGSRHSGVFAKSLVALGTLIALLAAASVYADTANVAADSPLYPFKRFSENVQLAVAPAPEKAELQATFAARRADEITDLETRKPSSTIIAGLASDLNTDIDASLDDAQKTNLQAGQLKTFCDKVLSAIATSSATIAGQGGHGTFSLRANIVGRFINQCGADLGGGTSATSSPAVARVPSSTRNVHLPLRKLFPDFFGTASSTITATTTVTVTATTTLTTTIPTGTPPQYRYNRQASSSSNLTIPPLPKLPQLFGR
jgi:hypothetical protein